MAFPRNLSQLLCSNEVPSQLDVAHVGEVADALLTAIGEAVGKVKQLEAELKKCRIVLSPARRLPQEILSEIFSLIPLFPSDPDAPADVAAVSLVSRDWRGAALNTHSLWQGLVFNPCGCARTLKATNPHLHHSEYERARVWLSRSGSLPKTVRLERPLDDSRCGCDDPRKQCESTQPTVVKLLAQLPLQIEEFALHVSSTGCFRKWAAAIEDAGQPLSCTSWMKLRCFALVFVDNDHHMWDDSDDPNFSIFTLLPPITELHLNLPSREKAFESDEVALACSLHIPVPILHGLKVFVIRWDWGGSKLAELLAHCINLESFTLDLDESDAFTELTDPVTEVLRDTPLVLGRLHELCLRRGHVHILEILRAPRLRTLDIEFSVPVTQTWDAVKRIGTFITESKIESTLTRLRICELLTTQSTIYLPLPVLPALQHLVLDSTGVSSYNLAVDGFFDDGSKKHPQFPSLVHFEALNLRRSSRTLQEEVSFLQRRAVGAPCLITASYRDDAVYSEGTLQTRLLSGKDVYLRVVPNQNYDDSRSWYV
ncbi:hypothetical protein D9611_012770 [Ephemerocybe angulata]|uniref:F-box domain-containing protein n=1 Tax=Ephemerocybe angulata TaxID=980116 RepID=A0A8H5CBV2_9AGAR|nr:hypothetical protein D9611_012770 [Tulosesus angulatus]